MQSLLPDAGLSRGHAERMQAAGWPAPFVLSPEPDGVLPQGQSVTVPAPETAVG